MKHLIIIVGLTYVLGTAAWTQSLPDSTTDRRPQRKGFVDENGDGINDRSRQQQRPRQRMDRFVDTNGDGISDSRECGLGFRRGSGAVGGMGKQTGKKGQGKK